MKIKVFFLLPILILFFSCENDMEKSTVIEGAYKAKVSERSLKDITYEVLLFEFTPDTGHNTSRLRYDIKYTNPNNFYVKGSSILTMDYDGLIVIPIRRVSTLDPYIKIKANSNFIESYDVEEKLNPDLGLIKSIKLVSVAFKIVEN